MRFLAILIVGLAALTGATIVSADNPHFVGEPDCSVVSGDRVNCSGKIAGLGQAPTTVEIIVDFDCTNRGGNQPPGQVSGTSGPIQPRGGQITFDETTGRARCPDQMTVDFGGFATINVFQNGTLVFTAQVAID